MITGLVVLKMVLMPSRHFLASLANSGPRWSMIGVSIARSTRSGSCVGPGMCRKWRPTGREEFFDITRPYKSLSDDLGRARLFCRSPARLAALKDECDSQSSLLDSGEGLSPSFRGAAQRRARNP